MVPKIIVSDKFINRIVEYSKREYSLKWRLLVVLLVALFLVILPVVLFIASNALDRWFGFSGSQSSNSIIFIISFILTFAGGLIAVWSVYVQLSVGKGTPAPLFPTQKLITDDPYRYSRNPMMLGAFILYAGIGFYFNSPSWLILLLIIFILFLMYVKFIEEKELEARFGKEYVEYKKRTPFLIPGLKLKGKNGKINKNHCE